MSIYSTVLKAERRAAEYRSSLESADAGSEHAAYREYRDGMLAIREQVLDCMHGMAKNPLFNYGRFDRKNLIETVRSGRKRHEVKKFIGGFTPLDAEFYMKKEKRIGEKVRRAEVVSRYIDWYNNRGLGDDSESCAPEGIRMEFRLSVL